jgi:trehalose/maltose hydrolase-like predicted phosphorylase
VEGQPLSMEQGQVLEHRRILDVQRGILWREWKHRDPNGRITRVTAFRFASLADRHLLVHSVVLSPENYSGDVRLETTIELPPNVLSSPPPDDWKTRRSAIRPNILPLALRSPGTDITVAFGVASQLVTQGHDAGRREIELDERRITERFQLEVEIGSGYRLDRLISIYTSRETEQPIPEAVSHVNRVLSAGIGSAVEMHSKEWEERWRRADIEVDGDDNLQHALRFAEYHLISAANPEDNNVSIGARALTGESYKGHVFWDTEIYMVPFYTFTNPACARALLMYRYSTLDAARAKARQNGYRGAMYPWESADTGEETTPRYVIAPGGEVIQVLNGDLEIHITGDVAYAVWQYWQVTGDDQFFVEAGAEIMLETARMWASRGTVESDGLYHIRHVIGPDEYHENVDDSAFTNIMAAWNLRRGVETAQVMQQRWPREWSVLRSRLQIDDSEIETWSHTADIMYTGFDPKTKLFEQFQGYFQKEPIDLLSYEPRNTAMDVILGHERIQQTNVVKQADVVMAIYLLWDEFPADVREANFRYYEPRTGHGSSLSPSIHAALAARFGDMELAAKYLRQSAEIDLGNNMGNAAGGVHAAAIGGLWQAMVFGFAGLEARAEGLSFNPHLLPNWRSLSFPFEWRGRKLRTSMEPGKLSVEVEEAKDALELALVGGNKIVARAHQRYSAEHGPQGWTSWKESRS